LVLSQMDIVFEGAGRKPYGGGWARRAIGRKIEACGISEEEWSESSLNLE